MSKFICIFFFFRLHIEVVAYNSCLTSLSMIISRSIHVAANGLFYSFVWLSNIPLCVGVYMCIPHLFYPFISGHSGCFHVLAIVPSAAVNIGVHRSFRITASLNVCLGLGFMDHMVALYLGF